MNPRRLSKPLSGRSPQGLRPVIRFRLQEHAGLSCCTCRVVWGTVQLVVRCVAPGPQTLRGWGPCPFCSVYPPEPVETLSVNEVGKEVGMGRAVGSLEEESGVDRIRSR